MLDGSYNGPTFQRVEEVHWQELQRSGFGARTNPLLVKGVVRTWPAYERWTFERLATLRRKDGSEVVFEFQAGLVEQGATRKPPVLPIGPYLQQLAASRDDPVPLEGGLFPYSRWKQIKPREEFHLDWSYMNSFQADRVYLAQWNILEEFPEMRKDFAIRTLWPGWRWTWEYVFIGPARTVTGVHYDFPNNWFCQVHGTKEVI